jgi:hypothetical protein
MRRLLHVLWLSETINHHGTHPSGRFFLRLAVNPSYPLTAFIRLQGHCQETGVDVMSRKSRSFLLMSLVPAVLIGGVFAAVTAQNAGSSAGSRWSDPATWPNGKAPAAGDKVIIGKDKQVLLDVSPPALGGLTIDGKLTFSNNADLELSTEWIMVHGELAIGSVAAPHTRKVSITFTDNVKGEDVMAGMGDRGIMIKFRALPTCCQDRGRFRLDSRRRERTRKRLERDAWQRPFARSLSPSLT